MPKKELDLLKLAARIMAALCAGSSKIMWREPWNVHTRGCLLENVADGLF
jgi:hypothetical protein